MKRLITLATLFMAVTINAQTYKIQKAWAFVTESMPGMIMKDDNGNTITPQPIVERFIYLETNYKGNIKTDSVWYNNQLYKAQATLITEAKHKAGVIYADGKPLYINPKKGNKLWRIDLQPADEKSTIKANAVKKIIIKGKLGNMLFKQSINTETRLTGPEYN